jgi:phage repressor protein C with HTH and peptisase S24 domain
MTQVKQISGAAERLLDLIDFFKAKTPTGLARLAGVPRSTIDGAIRRDAISPQTAVVLAEALKVRQEWLQFGTGPMREEDLPSGAYSLESSAVQRIIGAVPQEPLIQLTGEFVFIKKAAARLSAGNGLIPDESFVEERYAFRLDWLKTMASDPGQVVLMEIEGDSMSPTFEDGDTALIDLTKRTFKPGKLFAIGVGDIIQVKRLSIIPPGIIRILSDNHMYRPEEIQPDELRIIGRPIWFGRSLR